jgi:ABC-type oligopeptide transport system substrate-binding subunit
MKWMSLVLILLAPQEEPALRVAWGPVRVVDPALANSPQDLRVVEALFDGLGSAEAKADGAVVTFKLPARAWSDGKPVKASDYRYAWLRCLRPSTGSPWAFRFRHIKGARAWHDAEGLGERLILYDSQGATGRADIARSAREYGTKRHQAAIVAAIAIEKDEALKEELKAAAELSKDRADLGEASVGIEAVDERTLRVTLEAPRPGFAELAATTPFRPVPEHVVAARHDQWTHPGNLATCGTYGLEKWTVDAFVIARARGSEGPARVSFSPANTPAEAWPLYDRGIVEWLSPALVPPEKLEALAASGDVRTSPGPAVTFLRLSPSMKPGLRRAVALAVDREPLLKKSGPGTVEVRSLAGGGEAPARDLVAALTALTVEFPDLKVPRIRLLTWKGSGMEELARELRTQLEETLALSIRIDLREGPAYHAALASGEFEVALYAFAPEVGDPSGVLDLFADGRAGGEKKILEEALAVPLLREGEWFVAKPHVQAKPGVPLSKVVVKR